MNSISDKERIWYIDIARFYAMMLVFYGHFVERIMILKNPAAYVQYKFIYSFHMVLFFVIAGFITKDSELELSFGKFLRHRFFSRLLPFIFFTVIFMILPLVFSGEFGMLKLPSVKGYIIGFLLTVFGLPMFCVPSWFLLMIFSVELVHCITFRFLKSESKLFKNDLKILIGIICFYVIGYFLNLKFDFFNPIKRRIIGWNYLFIHEAIVMYAFYLFGVYLRRRKFLMEKTSWMITLPSIIFTFLIVLLTYNLNNGPFNFNYYNSVIILFSSHGDILWFPITAVAGSFLILFLGRITPFQKTIVWMGQNTLLLMILNGVCYHYINPRAAKWFVENLSGSSMSVLWMSVAMTIVSMALCIPFIYLFNKYLPQLAGKSKLKGPWIKNLI